MSVGSFILAAFHALPITHETLEIRGQSKIRGQSNASDEACAVQPCPDTPPHTLADSSSFCQVLTGTIRTVTGPVSATFLGGVFV